jgi:hypothetical protein
MARATSALANRTGRSRIKLATAAHGRTFSAGPSSTIFPGERDVPTLHCSTSDRILATACVCGPRTSGMGPLLLGPGHSKALVIAVLLGKNDTDMVVTHKITLWYFSNAFQVNF